MGTLDNFAGRLSDKDQLKSLERNVFFFKKMLFMVRFSLYLVLFLLPCAVAFAVVTGRSIWQMDFAQFALALGVLFVAQIGLAAGLRIIRKNKTVLIEKIASTPPLTGEELSFDPSKYVEPTNP